MVYLSICMASNILVEAGIDDGIDRRDVVEQLVPLSKNPSKSSPIDRNLDNLAVVVRDDVVRLRVEGVEGDWTKTSETALKDELKDVDAVESSSVEVVEGGYTDNQDEQEESSTDSEIEEKDSGNEEIDDDVEDEVGGEGVGVSGDSS